MNPLIQFKTTSLPLLIALALTCFGLLPTAQAITPPPDGGYPNNITAEGDGALNSIGPFAFAGGGQDDTALGFNTLYSNLTGVQNTAIGARALFHNVHGLHNTATGFEALFNNDVGWDNSAYGQRALFQNTAGQFNTAIGVAALFNNTTGEFNIALGSNAGQRLTTGSFNIDMGNGGQADESVTVRIGTDALPTSTCTALYTEST